MSELFKDKEHYFRVFLIAVGGALLFLIARGIFTPAGFGEYGHFRTGALADNAARPISYAGVAACGKCHADIVKIREGSKHSKISCEACHGPLAKHATDPKSMKPVRPDSRVTCPVCHEKNVARPSWFKQVDVAEHASGEACTSCHTTHHPEPDYTPPAAAESQPAAPASEVKP